MIRQKPVTGTDRARTVIMKARDHEARRSKDFASSADRFTDLTSPIVVHASFEDGDRDEVIFTATNEKTPYTGYIRDGELLYIEEGW